MDITDNRLRALVAKPPNLHLPNLVDEELSKLVAMRGFMNRQAANVYKKNCERIVCGSLLVMAIVAPLVGIDLVTVLFGLFGAYGLILLVLLLPWAACLKQTASVSQAFHMRRYDRVSELLPSAVHRAVSCYPITKSQLSQLQTFEANILLLEGRTLELEIHARFLWAFNESRQDCTGLPKSRHLAINLAISWMNQGKYQEAAKVFASQLLPKLRCLDTA